MSLSPQQLKLQKRMLSTLKFKLFKLFKLPLAFFVGLRLKALDEDSAITEVKYKYLNKNPFKSIYFAVLAMTAELSTGVLAIFSMAKHDESIAVLVVESNGKFLKKATGRIRFTCNDGAKFKSALQKCVAENTPVQVTACAQGFNDFGDLVCEYYFTWSFKVRETVS